MRILSMGERDGWFFGYRFLGAHFGGVGCATAVTVLWCVASLWFPFGWDQGIFASVGDVILRGGMPYRDAWDMKGPLPYYVFALIQWLFGNQMWGARVLDLSLLLAGAVALSFIVARITSPLCGYLSAIALVLWIGSQGWFATLQPDEWVANLVLLGIGPLVSSSPSLRKLLFSGLIVGCVALIKPFYLGFLAVPLVLIATQRPSAERSRIGQAVALGGVALVPPVLALTWFAYHGALKDLVEVHLIYSSLVYSGNAMGSLYFLGNIARFFLIGIVPLALPVILIGVRSLWRDSRNSAFLLLTWAAVAMMCVLAQGKFYPYHWMPLFPPLVILAAAGFHSLLTASETAHRPVEFLVFRRLTILLGATLVLQLTVVPASGLALWFQLMTGVIDSKQYYTAHRASEYVAGDDMRAAQYIRERTSPTDGVVVWGNNALVNFLSERANPTRFVFGLPLTAGGNKDWRDKYRREYMTELQKNLPAYFVVGLPHASPNKEQELRTFPELATLLRERYSLETQIGFLDLYRHNR